MMVESITLIFIFSVLCVQINSFNLEDLDLPLAQLVPKYGYPFEEHELVTRDGYILTTHRIPHGKSSSTPNKKPFLFIHGMGGSSENIISLGPGRSLAFVLAERGYDVWLMNARGNYFSRNHKYLDPNGVKFWDFGLDEISTIDTPLNIDHILNVTKQKKVALLGHSQGSAICFAITSALPEYNKKISIHVHFAPSIFHGFITEKFTKVLSRHGRILEQIGNALNLVELCPPNILATNRQLLKQNENLETFIAVFSHIGGTKSKLVKKEDVPFLFRSTPGGLSLRQLLQFLQSVNTGMFSKYDFGETENLRRYNSTRPPFYDIRKSKSPAILVHLKKDWLSPVAETEYLKKHLPNIAHVMLIEDEEFSHFDLVGAYNAKYVVYDPLIDIMDKVIEH